MKRAAGSAFSHGIKLSQPRREKRPAAARAVAPRRGRQPGRPAGTGGSPFPGFPRPAGEEVVRLHTALARLFGARHPKRAARPTRQILDTVVGTILSQNTTNTNSHRAFQQLKRKFGTWDAVRTARPAAVQAAIKCGGLAPKKTRWIQHVLRTLHRERGKTSLEYLRKETKEGVHAELERFQGIGKKTSAIINLFDVRHPDMAVDTHVFRYAVQLGWVPTDAERAAHNARAARAQRWPTVTRDAAYGHLDAAVPDRLKYSMHLLLTDTVGGLPTRCGAGNQLSFDGRVVRVDSKPLR